MLDRERHPGGLNSEAGLAQRLAGHADSLFHNRYAQLVAGMAAVAIAPFSGLLHDAQANDSAVSGQNIELMAANIKTNQKKNEIKLVLIGPNQLPPQSSTSETLVAKNTTGKTLSKITLEEIGPGNSKHKWLIPKFRPGPKHERRKKFQIPAEAATAKTTNASITLEAFQKGHRIGLVSEVLKYASRKPGSGNNTGPTSPSGTTGNTGPTGSTGEPLPPGIYLTGPRTVSLKTKYTYQIEVVPGESIKGATILISVPESEAGQRITANLKRLQPWTENYSTKFTSTNELATEGIGIAVIAPPSKKQPTGAVVEYQPFPMTLDPDTSSS